MSDHHRHDDEHDHDGDHHHPHGNRPLTDPELRVKALEQVLAEKGLIDPIAVDELIDTYETKVGPHNGARVVAKAWLDRDYKQRLLSNGTAAIAELGYSGIQGEESLYKQYRKIAVAGIITAALRIPTYVDSGPCQIDWAC